MTGAGGTSPGGDATDPGDGGAVGAVAYDAVVFDQDGVLVGLTEEAVLRRAAARAFEDVGVADPAERFVSAAANGDVDALADVESRYDVALTEYWRARERRAVEFQRAVAADGGKRPYDDVAALGDIDARLGVVSNNQGPTVEFVLASHGLADLFDHVAGREPTLAGMERRKPDPHYLDRAVEALDAGTALYVGDAPTDVEAAARAGLDSAFLRRDHNRSATVDGVGGTGHPTFEVDGLDELVAALAE